jgi:hypothetical protein
MAIPATASVDLDDVGEDRRVLREQGPVQVLLGGLDLVQRPLVLRQLADHRHQLGHVVGGGRPDGRGGGHERIQHRRSGGQVVGARP